MGGVYSGRVACRWSKGGGDVLGLRWVPGVLHNRCLCGGGGYITGGRRRL